MKMSHDEIQLSERKAKTRALLLGCAAVSGLISVPSSFAQEVPAPEGQASSQDVGEIIVTGTSIRGVAPTGSNLISVGTQEVIAQGAASSSEVLSTVPQLGNFGAPHESTTPNRYRTAGYLPNIHGLGIYATLSLFNGHRFAATGGEGVFPDPQIVPVIALERVEVIADGASSIYGSDAVAGVVNLIYRRNFDGIEFSSLYGSDGDYRRRGASLLAGHTWDSGSVMAAYEYSGNDSPQYRDFDFIRGDHRDRGGRDFRSTSCEEPNVVADGTTYGLPGFTSAANRCDPYLNGDVVPSGDRHAFLMTARQALGDRVEAFLEFNYSDYSSLQVNSPAALSIRVPNTNPYFIAPPGSSATEVTVNRSGAGLFPDPVTVQRSKVIGFTTGLNIDLGGDWEGNVLLHSSKTDDYVYAGELDAGAAQRLALNTSLDTAFNPFGSASDNNPAVLAQIDNDYSSINDANQYLREVQLSANGSLLSIPGGDIRAAIGTSIREEQTKQIQTGGSPTAIIPVRNDDISRTVSALFAEVHVPIFGSGNAVTGIQRLDLSLSGRYDHYERLGGTFNPKIGFVWEPVLDVSFRGSYGTSYVAPNIGKTTRSFGLPREGVNVSGLGTLNVYNMGGGNPDLESEEADTYSLGVDWEPFFAPGLKLSATYFDVSYTNLLYQPGTQDLFFNPFFADRLIMNPTPEQVAAAIAFSPPARAVPEHIDAIYATYTMNLGTREVGGLDLDARYQFDTSFGSFSLGLNALHFMKFDQQILPDQPVNSRLGTNEAIKWKGRASLAWNYDPVTVSLFANYIGSYDNITVTPREKVDALTTFDLAVAYDLPGMLDATQLVLRAKNLFDKEPPFYNGTYGYDPRVASPFGRMMEITFRGNF